MGIRLAWAVVANSRVQAIGGLSNKSLFLTVLGVTSPSSECLHGQILVRTFFLAYRWLSVFLLYPHREETERQTETNRGTEKERGRHGERSDLFSYEDTSTIVRLYLHNVI